MAGFYTTEDLADEIGVSTETVARWIRQGRFPGAFRRGPRWRIPADEAEDFMRGRWGWAGDEDDEEEGDEWEEEGDEADLEEDEDE